MKTAIIRTGGKQYLVTPGATIRVETLTGKPEEQVSFNDVLLVMDDNNVTVGQPVVPGTTVTGTIVAHGKSKKVSVVKFKSKVRYRRNRGHRQQFTEVKIKDVAA